MCKHISHSLQQDLGDAFLRKKDILQYLNDLMMDKQGNNAVLYQKDKRSRWSRNCELKTVSVFWQTDSHAVRLCFIKCGCRGISKPWSVFKKKVVSYPSSLLKYQCTVGHLPWPHLLLCFYCWPAVRETVAESFPLFGVELFGWPRSALDWWSAEWQQVNIGGPIPE